jgi:hypothetical protein
MHTGDDESMGKLEEVKVILEDLTIESKVFERENDSKNAKSDEMNEKIEKA